MKSRSSILRLFFLQSPNSQSDKFFKSSLYASKVRSLAHVRRCIVRHEFRYCARDSRKPRNNADQLLAFLINLLFVAAQWVLLRRSINKVLLLAQIPITLAFSYFIDTSMKFTEFLSSDVYWKCLAVSMLGNMVLGLGVALEVFSGAAALPGEGLVLAVSTVLHKPFSSVKIANDVILVLLALLLSYFVFHGIRGLREGTIISALCVGFFVRFWLSGLTKLFKRAPADTE